MSYRPYVVALVAAGAIHASAAVQAEPDCIGVTPIYNIQGAGHVSSLVDETLETCGVVTAVAFSGYYLQDVAGDDNEATSDGIYVAERDEKPTVGSHIRLSATVAEVIGGGAASGNLSVTTLVDTELLESVLDSALPATTVIGSEGRLPPTDVVISESEITGGINLQDATDAASTPFNPEIDGIDFYESLEGMRVLVVDPVAISGIRQFGTFSAEVFVLTDGGSDISPVDARTPRGGITLQPDLDNRGDQQPERMQIQFDGTLFGSTDYPAIKVGDTLGSVTGIMGYSFGNFEVLAVGPVSVNEGDLQPEITYVSADETTLTLASYNVLNLSGADADDDQRALVATQIVDNLQQPDIIALQEIQDNNGDIGDCPRDDSAACAGVLDASLTLQRLADAIVSAGGVEYIGVTVDPLVETNDDNRDDVDTFGGSSLGNIRNAFLYNPARVTLLSVEGLTRDVLQLRGVSAFTAFDTSRDPLEAIFDFNGERFTVFNNHFSSRFGSSPIFGGPQPFIQAGEENRAAQSLAMNQLVEVTLAQDEAANVVVLGDLNTFDFTDELVEVLPAAGGNTILFNLIGTAGEDPYSFIFEGNSQALDHIFVSSSLEGLSFADYVNVNVDFPRLSSSIVGSDHEPVLAAISSGTQTQFAFQLSAQVYSESAIELFWDRQSDMERYDVYRNGVLLTSTDAVSYFDDTLQQGTEYLYRVEGFSQGNLQVSDTVTLRTDATGGPGVFNVQELSGSVYSATALELFWAVSEQSAPPTGFDILRNDEFVATTDGRSFFEEGLQSDTTYEYSVRAFDDNGNISSAESITLKTRSFADMSAVSTGPSAVSSVTGLVYSSSALEIFWVPAVSGSPAVAYQVLRDDQLIETLDGRSFFDSELERDTRYRYTIRPVDSRGNAGASIEVSLTTAAL